MLGSNHQIPHRLQARFWACPSSKIIAFSPNRKQTVRKTYSSTVEVVVVVQPQPQPKLVLPNADRRGSGHHGRGFLLNAPKPVTSLLVLVIFYERSTAPFGLHVGGVGTRPMVESQLSFSAKSRAADGEGSSISSKQELQVLILES